MRQPTLKLNEQHYLVSPCGFMADWFHVDAIEEEAPGWFDCTAADLSDAEIGKLMERRMWASSLTEKAAA